MEKYNFDDIRSFRDTEVNSVLKEILTDKGFLYILKKIFTDERIENLSNELNEVHTVYDFQSKYISYYVQSLIKLSISELTVEGIENVEPNKAYLFISNHRDIILDSALINETLHQNGRTTSEIAIGNNLLIYKWIENLARLNKSFIVRRDLIGKELLQASVKLSAYIRENIKNGNTSVWIAQREGRTKDGNDLTDIALLKMLNFSGSGNLISDFEELNILPVSISYENEPTVESKIGVTYSKINGVPYQKSVEDDLKDMGRGLYSLKGNVCISFGKPINSELAKIPKDLNKNEQLQFLGELIDKTVYKNFKLYKNNYIAFDILNYSDKFLKEKKYLKEEETKFRIQCKKTIQLIEGELDALERIFYKLYANPLINKIQMP